MGSSCVSWTLAAGGIGTRVMVFAGGSNAIDVHGRPGTAVAGVINVHPTRPSRSSSWWTRSTAAVTSTQFGAARAATRLSTN